MNPIDAWIKQFNNYDKIPSYVEDGELSVYVGLNPMMSILSNGVIWSNDIDSFPDPNEGTASLEYVKKHLDELIHDDNEKEEVLKEIEDF